MRRVAVCALVAALGLPAAADAAEPRYRFVATSTLTVVATSTCTARDGAYRTTESFTWELHSRHVGTSEIGRGDEQPKGSTRLSGTIRRQEAHETEGFAPGEPQGGTEPLQESEQAFGVLHRAARGRLELRLSHLGLPDPRFAPLEPGASRTIRQRPQPETFTSQASTTDTGQCTDEERRELSRRVVVTRVR